MKSYSPIEFMQSRISAPIHDERYKSLFEVKSSNGVYSKH